MDCFSGSLNFVINNDHDLIIQSHKAHVKLLFGVTIHLENGTRRKRWVNLKGSEDQLSKAKEYILALTNPEITSTVENVLNHPKFTQDKQNEIERNSSAVLLRCDDKSETSLQIKGTAFSVTVAKSLIEEVLFKASEGATGVSASYDPVMAFSDGAEEDCIITEARLMSNSRSDPQSSSVAEPQVDMLNMKFKNRLDTILMASKSIDDKRGTPSTLHRPSLQSRKTASFLSPHGREQQAYLRNLAVASKYDEGSVEEALLSFDMNDIIPPANFISAVQEISQQKATSSKQHAGTKSMAVDKELDASVICLDSSDEETYVMRPFEDNKQNKRRTDPKDTIVLSSDDDQENERPEVAKSNQLKLYGKEMSQTQPSYLASVYKGQQDTRTQPFVGNVDQRPVSSCFAKMPTANNPPPDLLAVNTPVPGIADLEQSEEMRLRKEYLEGLMRAAPKGPKTGLRYIVIDGSNVAMGHGNNVQFSALGIEICIKYFLSRGHNNITAFVPEWRRYTNQISSHGRALLEKLNKAGFVKFTPARRVGNRTIASYDDRFILNLAVEEEGIIVSNDQYRDLQDEQASYKDAVMNRLLQFTFVGNHFMPPDDPLGRFGPSLDQFLHYPVQPTGPGRGAIPVSSAPSRDSQDGTAPKSTTAENQETFRMLPLRTKAETEKLFIELIKVFPEPHQLTYVHKVLANHKRENNLNRLSIYCINAMTT